MLSCLKLARKTTKDRRVGSSLLTRLFYRASAPFVTALTERAGDTTLDFLTAEAPLCDRSATYRGLQGRGLSLDHRLFYRASAPFVTALAERAGSLALNPPPPPVFLRKELARV